MKPAIVFLITVFVCFTKVFCQDDCMALQNLADSLHNVNQYQQAINTYSKIILLNCGSLQAALNNRGSMYDDLQKYDSALVDFNKAYGIDSTYPTTLVNLGVCYANQEEFPLAIVMLNKATKYSDQPSWIFNILGGVKAASGDTLGPIKDYQSAIAADKHNIQAYNNLIKLYSVLDSFKAEEKTYDTLIANNADNPEFILQRAVFYYKHKEVAKAAADYTTILKADPDNYEVYVNRALCYELADKPAAALKDYNVSIAINENYMAYYNRARLYHKFYNNNKQAIKDNLKCVELNPEYATGWLSLGNYYENIEQYTNAKKAFETGLAKSPDEDTRAKLAIRLKELE